MKKKSKINVYRIFDNILEGLQIIDNNGAYSYINIAASKQGKSTVADLLGKKMTDMYKGIENTEMYKQLLVCMNTGKSQKMINEFNFSDSSVGYFELRMEKVEAGVLILSIDVTEQIKLEKELKKLNKHLEKLVNDRTNELVCALAREKHLSNLKSRFVSMASHEFKNPLAAIKLTTTALEDLNTPPHIEERKKLHGYIKISVKEMMELVNEFLSADKIEHGDIQRESLLLNVPEIISSKIEKMNFFCKKNQKILHTHSGNNTVFIDEQIFKSIVTNLLSNALKYSSADVVINTTINKCNLTLTVKDKGIGIPENEKQKMFERYFRASNTKNIQGTGLGLNIVKKYIDLLQGKIDIKSTIGKGTSVTVTIPLVNSFKKEKSKLLLSQ